MISNDVGKMAKGLYVLGTSQFPVYLVDGPEPVLVEAGVTAAGLLYEKDAKVILENRAPTRLFLTHSHWDHCGAASHLKKTFPSMRIIASKKTDEVLRRETARKLIISLNRDARSIIAAVPYVEPSQVLYDDFQPFNIDVTVADGDMIALDGGERVEVLATPGHTRDFVSYYLTERRIAIASEAAGCLDSSGKIAPQFVSDYDAYLASLRRLAELPADILCQGHRLVFMGKEEVSVFLSRSINETELFKTKVEGFFAEEKGSIEAVIRRVKAELYDTVSGMKQPEGPYLLNLQAQIRHLAGKLSFHQTEK